MKPNFNHMKVDSCLHESAAFAIYKVQSDQVKAILKVKKGAEVHEGGSTGLDREFEIGQHLNVPSALKVLARGTYHGKDAILMEGFFGQSLNNIINQKLSPLQFLDLAMKIVSALKDIHARNVVHRDLKPSNIIYNQVTQEVKLADFGIASVLSTDEQIYANPLMIEGSFPYMSPEQTGRINHPIDFRSDLYSLGIMFYQMITGAMPFQATDILEWVHCHIARIPQPPAERSQDIPVMISKIIMKLLSKLPEDRYQTTQGLLSDLEECHKLLTTAQKIPEFELATKDRSYRFQIPHKLYGRVEDQRLLFTIFQRLMSQGNPEYVLIAGYSGIGKTSLVLELYRPLVQKHGLFASGKFDQLKKHIPYYALSQALKEIVQHILIQDEKSLRNWRENFLQAFGVHGKLITDLVPELELIIGTQPEVPVLGTQEAQNRFNLTLQNFIRLLSSKDHPLIIFLDDMQWADQASISFIQTIAADLELQYVCFIFAYRDNEVDANHPFIVGMDKIRSQHFNVSTIHLSPLNLEAVQDLICDTLYTSKEESLPLARLIKQKTEGNAFFTLELLKSLHRLKMLTYDTRKSKWQWDLKGIQQLGISDNVVDLMIKRLQELPENVLITLELAACVGIRFNPKILSHVLKQDATVTATSLKIASNRGLIHQHGEDHAFNHDRIQQAAYTLIESTARSQLHLQVANSLLELNPDQVEKNLFQIVNQFNSAIDLIQDEAIKDKIAQLNLDAAIRSKATNAYTTGLSYFNLAKDLFGPDLWQTDYAKSLFLYRELAETAFLAGELPVAKETFQKVLDHAETKTDKASVYYLQIKLFQVAGNFAEAIRISLDAFSQFGLDMPKGPEDAGILLSAEMEKARAYLDGRSPITLLNHPLMKDPEIKALVDLLEASGPPAYMARPELFPVIAMKMVNFSFESGNTETSCYGYGIYAILLAGAFNQVELGYEFAQLALSLNEKFNDPKLKGAVQHLMGDHVNFWKNHVSTDIPILEKGFESCVQGGDLIYSNYIGFQLPFHHFESGTKLDKILAETQRYLIFASKTKYDAVVETIRLEQTFLRNLAGIPDEDHKEERLAIINEANFSCGTVYYHIMELITHYHNYEFERALESAKHSKAFLSAAFSMPIEFSYYFFHALAITASYEKMSPLEKQSSKELADSYLEKFHTWSISCPVNFECRYLLLKAELLRIEGKTADALPCYEHAIKAAVAGRFIHVQAMAYELAGQCYQNLEISSVATYYLDLAFDTYGFWGAHGKNEKLKKKYKTIDFKKATPSRTATSSANELDFLSVIKASQTISREIELPNLLQTLMEVVLEHASANKGFLLLYEGGSLTIEASASVNEDAKKSFLHERVHVSSETSSLPLSIVHYVQRTQSKVILENAQSQNPYTNDPYIERVKPKSLVCLPILRNKILTGIIYLENHFVYGAFQEGRLSTLELLASQLSISIENSRLYANSQKSIHMRDEFLSIASHELRTPLTSLLMQVQMRKRKFGKEPTATVSPAEIREMSIKDEGKILRISRLIDDMLDISKINSNNLAINKKTVHLNQLIKDSAEQMREHFKTNNQALEIALSEDVWCECDSSRIEQVLTNLLSNAMKYGKRNPVKVSVSKAQTTALIKVEDQGLGIEMKDQARIFKQFERAISLNEISGLGLGLYISRKIIEAHGGSLSVESKFEEGSTFTITLPLT